ncbi:hypothetical protein EDB19DRAFT_1634619, partial [Suillus lakei]
RVMTYKDTCVILGQGTPRSGVSLDTVPPIFDLARINPEPFTPFVPYHRVIVSKYVHIGEFFGEARAQMQGVEMLAMEDVMISVEECLADEFLLWIRRC